jgi:IS30 family transposase
MRVSREAILQARCVQGRGALRRGLTACLWTGRTLRVTRARTQRFVGREIMISERTARGRRPGRCGSLGGDLTLGLGSSAIGTRVERSTRFTMLLRRDARLPTRWSCQRTSLMNAQLRRGELSPAG